MPAAAAAMIPNLAPFDLLGVLASWGVRGWHDAATETLVLGGGLVVIPATFEAVCSLLARSA